jgi:hypothetical protein
MVENLEGEIREQRSKREKSEYRVYNICSPQDMQGEKTDTNEKIQISILGIFHLIFSPWHWDS